MQFDTYKLMRFDDEKEKNDFYAEVMDENYAKWLFYTCTPEEIRLLAFFAAVTNKSSLAQLAGVITFHPDTKEARCDLKLLASLCDARKQYIEDRFVSLQQKGILFFNPVMAPYFTLNPLVRNIFRSIIDANRLA